MGHPTKAILAGAIDIGKVFINRKTDFLVKGHIVKELLVWLNAEFLGKVDFLQISKGEVGTFAGLVLDCVIVAEGSTSATD